MRPKVMELWLFSLYYFEETMQSVNVSDSLAVKGDGN